jgi:small subunit ribosomal protein S1
MDGTDIREREGLTEAAEPITEAPEPSTTAAEPTTASVAAPPAADDSTATAGAPEATAPVAIAEAPAADAPAAEATPAPPAPEASAPEATGTGAAGSNGTGDDFGFGMGDDFGDAASLMEQFLTDPSHDYKSLKYGDVMDGVIMHVDREELLVDIGSKSEGIIPAREYSDLTPEEKQALQVGDTILVFVVQPENPEGHPVVSINRARQEKSWRRLQEIHEANQVIEAEVTNYNKGGLLVNLDGVRGFVPASQVSEIRGGDEASKQADMARLIGTSLPLKVIEINRHRNRLILSERQAIQERRDVMKEKLIAELKEGEVRTGRVSSICDFGAFVDIGGADGLVHLSELSWSRVRHPSEVLKVGQEAEVYVLGINAQEKKIALSIKRTQAEPWSRVATAYEVGQLVRGTVTQLANFGAFARIEDGIEGLIHVSELADERITHPKQAVQEGQELLLRIIRIDPQRRRMGLSLRRALDTPDSELIAVFGEEAVAERDRIAQQIRTALEAEGIEIGSGRPRSDDPEIARTALDPSSPDAIAALMETPIQQVAASTPGAGMANFQLPTERPQPRSKPRREQNRPQPSNAAGIEGDEEMSAMAMAFAMAGAKADLVEAAASDDEAQAEPAAEELVAEVTTPATTDAPAPEASAPAEASGADGSAVSEASLAAEPAADATATSGAAEAPAGGPATETPTEDEGGETTG